jgi:hypothetical protein
MMPDDRDYLDSPVYEKLGGNREDARTDAELNKRYNQLRAMGSSMIIATEMYVLLRESGARYMARKAIRGERGQ